jgi:hypothetical protein
MGFWKELGKALGEVAAKAGEGMAEDITFAYDMGKTAGRNGSPSNHQNYRRTGYKPEWLDAYSRGYIAGCEERRKSGKT